MWVAKDAFTLTRLDFTLELKSAATDTSSTAGMDTVIQVTAKFNDYNQAAAIELPADAVTAVTTQTLQWSSPPAMTIDTTKQYTADIKTNLGDITVELFPEEAPMAVNNFVFLADQGFYNGVTFHRVIKDFMIQGGDPTGTGSGGPGYTFANDQPITRDYVPGTLAMANSGNASSNGSQFFITLTNLSDTTNINHLSKDYVIFGLVTSGFDVVQNIGNVPTTTGGDGAQSKPTVDVHIDSVTITVQ